MKDKPEVKTIEMPPRDYQPSKAELAEEFDMPGISEKQMHKAFFWPIQVKTKSPRKTKKMLPCLVLFLCLCPVLAGQAPPPNTRPPVVGEGVMTTVIPTAANTIGRHGAVFKTRVVLHNLAEHSYNVQISIYRQEGISFSRRLRLEAKGYYVWDNFLEELFGFRGNCAIGIASWVHRNWTAPNQFSVTAEVYNDSPKGRFSTTIVNGLIPSRRIFKGPFHPTKAFHAGITVNEEQRVNIGVFNNFSRDNKVTARVYDRAGNEVQRNVFYLKLGSWNQKSINVPVTNGYIEWDIAEGDPDLWAITINNKSNDGVLTWAVSPIPWEPGDFIWHE